MTVARVTVLIRGCVETEAVLVRGMELRWANSRPASSSEPSLCDGPALLLSDERGWVLRVPRQFELKFGVSGPQSIVYQGDELSSVGRDLDNEWREYRMEIMGGAIIRINPQAERLLMIRIDDDSAAGQLFVALDTLR